MLNTKGNSITLPISYPCDKVKCTFPRLQVWPGGWPWQEIIFYERVKAIVNPNKATNRLYLNDISAFWVPGTRAKCSQVYACYVRHLPVFEWMKENNVRDKVLVCFEVLSHTKKGNRMWLLSETTEVMWSNCNTHLVTFHGPLQRRNCPLDVNAEALKALLPHLQQAEDE